RRSRAGRTAADDQHVANSRRRRRPRGRRNLRDSLGHLKWSPWRPPVNPVDAPTAQLSVPANTGSTPAKISVMHILIVEDDAVARDYLAKALREVGHTVDVAPDGLEGLQMASSAAMDLAI